MLVFEKLFFCVEVEKNCFWVRPSCKLYKLFSTLKLQFKYLRKFSITHFPVWNKAQMVQKSSVIIQVDCLLVCYQYRHFDALKDKLNLFDEQWKIHQIFILVEFVYRIGRNLRILNIFKKWIEFFRIGFYRTNISNFENNRILFLEIWKMKSTSVVHNL